MPLRPCLDCGGLSKGGRCQRCRGIRERARGSRQQRGYNTEWEHLVGEAIRLHPWCTDCGITQVIATATGNPLTGDHQRWPAQTIEDIDVVCRRCNSSRGPLRVGLQPPHARDH